jgi:hypothetical protein
MMSDHAFVIRPSGTPSETLASDLAAKVVVVPTGDPGPPSWFCTWMAESPAEAQRQLGERLADLPVDVELLPD